jgi:ABC-type Na+ efflux pump permease subunit
MNWRAIRAIVRKDLKVVAQSKGVMIPLMVVPLVFLLLLPGGTALLLSNDDLAAEGFNELEAFLVNLPAGIQTELDQYESETQQLIHLVIIYQFAPLFLILPLMVSSVIGADSFAGEKERKTLEALIYTPTTNGELYLGKMLSAWLPAIAVALGGFVIYGVVVNATAWPVMGRAFFPNLMWIVLVIWVAPAAAGLGLAAMVLVSSRVRGFQEAYQLGSMVVIPIVLLMLGQVGGVLYFNIELVLILGLLLWGVDIGLLWYGARSFQRSELIAQL